MWKVHSTNKMGTVPCIPFFLIVVLVNSAILFKFPFPSFKAEGHKQQKQQQKIGCEPP